MAKYSRYPKASQPRIYTLVIMIVALLIILIYGKQIAETTAKLMLPSEQGQDDVATENKAEETRLPDEDDAEPPRETTSEE